MPVNSRILTCSYNRRRFRIAPQHHDESTMQATKPQLNPLKARPDNHTKLAVVSENISAWPTMDKDLRTPSLSLEEDSEPEAPSLSSMFRRRTSLCDQDDDGDMFLLKRANPVYDSDDEDYMASPTKRQRTTEPSVLHWDEQLCADEGSFAVSFLPSH